MAKKKNRNKNKNLNSPRGKIKVIKIESPEMELLKRRDRLRQREDLLVPYALRQVQAAQERARLKSQATPFSEFRKPVPVKETVVTANGMELKRVSSIRELGYTVTLSREARWDLLNNVIIPRVGKEETIKHIKFLITMNRNQPNKISVVYEWEYDLRRLEKVHRKKGNRNKNNRVLRK